MGLWIDRNPRSLSEAHPCLFDFNYLLWDKPLESKNLRKEVEGNSKSPPNQKSKEPFLYLLETRLTMGGDERKNLSFL